MELARGPTLFDALDDYRDRGYRMPEQLVRDLAHGMVHALYYVHHRSIVHRDVKLENWIFEAPLPSSPAERLPQVKLIDFGFAATCAEGAMLPSPALIGTPGFRAPEQWVACGDGHSFPVDMFALGVCFYVMLTGIPPFQSAETAADLYDEERDGDDPAVRRPFWVYCNGSSVHLARWITDKRHYDLLWPERRWRGISAAARCFVAGLLEFDQYNRTSAQQALCDDWLLADD
eukprot:TRINITY_DN3853_c0_g1_i1.p1 TRINITY_DN3853_c0_g1~~TRINITY_DN3853_c0_g1_i1.p1  ORF type:complete len:232 (-),score=56.40 TRINITY_DN3853_c0_g1_i1:144-839(-)